MNTISPLDRSKHFGELTEAQFHLERLRCAFQSEMVVSEEVVDIVATCSAKVINAVHDAEACVNKTFKHQADVMLHGVKISKAEIGMEVLTVKDFIEKIDQSYAICGVKPLEVNINENCWNALIDDARNCYGQNT